MRKNDSLHIARAKKNDEFYTLMTDIEAEMPYYREQLNGLRVLCPCDTEDSNFVKFFCEHFEDYGLAGLIATHYNPEGNSYRLDYVNGELIKTPIMCNGDFRNEEIKKIAKEEADIIITNPPFSLFRDFITFLEETE